jgi:hypothetical protein
MRTHTSYAVSKRLKEFLGESAPEPMGKCYWDERGRGIGVYAPKAGPFPAYRLEDLLSRPFCEAFEKRGLADCGSANGNKRLYRDVPLPEDLRDGICRKYYAGGLEAVEAALMKMMDGEGA